MWNIYGSKPGYLTDIRSRRSKMATHAYIDPSIAMLLINPCPKIPTANSGT
jgi:hypothetical protein